MSDEGLDHTRPEHARAPELAQHGDEMFYKAFHASPSPSAITRVSDGCYIDVNRSLLRMLGYTYDEMVGHTSLELQIWINPENRARTYQKLKEGTAQDLEWQFRTKLGEIKTVIFSAVELSIAGEECILSTTLDISERKRAEEERAELLRREQEAREEAEAAVRARDELLSIVSHDLKNPLSGIIANGQMLRRRIERAGGPEAESLVRMAERVGDTASRMLVLLDELMDFGQAQSGQPLSLQKRSSDLVAIVGRVVEEYRERTNMHQIEIEYGVGALPLWIDAGRIERALANLLSNAIKYSPWGGQIKVTLSLEGEESESWAVVSVRDEGLGIPAQEIPHIFEWFRRAAKHSTRISGAGIGLASARQVVEQHGGSISVESEEGKGSTFTVRLPAAQLPA
ncbi:MAG TPA: PAS domain-containing sensor histidine kinase [Chloroflexia bacterium]|nr:PAS domain-containing sensor histidine kinase [Chloroflexia bacterium]